MSYPQSVFDLHPETDPESDRSQLQILGISQDLEVCRVPRSAGNFPTLLGTKVDIGGAEVTP